MLLDEKLRRAADWMGLLASAFGMLALAGPALGLASLENLGLGEPPIGAATASCLVLAGASLWFQNDPRRARVGTACAALTLLIAAVSGARAVFESLFGAVDPAALPVAGLQPNRVQLHTALVLCLLALALLVRRQTHARRRWPVSAWLASAVGAVAVAALLARAFDRAGELATTISLGPPVAAALLLLGTGTLLASPEDRPVRILFERTAAGALARRLFLGVAVMPVLFSGMLAVLLRDDLIGLVDGVLLLATTLVLAGFAVALFSVETAVGIDDRREEAEQARELLTTRLREQAAQLQDIVGQRTRELHEVNASLRAAAESNARLALVAHHTTNGVVIADADGRVEWVNAAYEHMTGYLLAELKGRKPGSVLQGPGTDPATIVQVRQAVAKGEPSKIEILNYTKQGRPFWQVLDIQPVRDQAGRIINFIAINRDVTEQRAATHRQHALNQRLRLATRAAALGVWEWDATTQKSSWDDRTLEIYGLTREQFNGTAEDWTDRLHPDDRSRAQASFQKVLAGANEYEQEFRILRAHDGALRHLQSRAIVQRDTEGRLLRITGTERDVTTEREAVQGTEALNERLRLALRSSNYGVWELDIATDRLAWDDRMFELYGVRREQSDGTRAVWIKHLHPEDRAAAIEYARKVVAGELAAYDTEYRILRPDGSVRYIEAHGYLQHDAAGKPVRLVGLNRDITAEKQMQEALDLAEQRWQLAIEGTNDSVWDWNIATGFVFHDARWAQMLGFAPAEIDNSVENWRRLVHPEDLAAHEAALQEHFALKTPFYRLDLRIKTANGEWKWILDRGQVVSRAPDGRPLRMAGTHTDITARKILEQRLRQVEELSDQVSRLALIGGWEIDLATSHLTWSSGLRRIHDVDDAFQPTVATMLGFYPAEARETLRAALHVARSSGTPIDLELPLTTAQGRPIWVRVLGKAELQHGKALRLHGAMQDITVQHEGEGARRQLEMQLFQAQKMETLGTLAGGIAHDFNNLLTGIIGYHELAADSVPADHPAHLCLAEARHASLRARELVEQILTFGRQSNGVEHGSLDLALVIEEARRFLRATLPAVINIQLEAAPECGHVLADATQIHQVLLNLGSNAAHAMRHQGGTLRIALSPVNVGPDLALSLGGLAVGAYVCIAVSDTGHGMDEATRRRIFDPFFTTKNSREGTGLGLAVVHGIVRAHRGAIDVDSTPGAGTTFHIYLPAAASEDEGVKSDQAPAPRGAGEIVCVVDDEEVVGSCTKLVLENRGYRTVVYSSGEHCLAAMTGQPGSCTVLVTDQTMPGIQGTELAAALRKLYPGLPVVIMSGYFSKITPEALDELGQVELLAKPFTTDELSLAVHRALHPAETAE